MHGCVFRKREPIITGTVPLPCTRRARYSSRAVQNHLAKKGQFIYAYGFRGKAIAWDRLADA
jgi:hypothetical protein